MIARGRSIIMLPAANLSLDFVGLFDLAYVDAGLEV